MNLPKLLFLCTGNSCRSQMAEGWARALVSDYLVPYSAGIEKHGLNPRAVAVMAEAGIDISGQQSQTVDELGVEFDLVVTVCGHANENCPVFPGTEPILLHVGFEDPPKLAKEAASEEEAWNCYRRIRDEIRDFVVTLPSIVR